jgi:hypothetical protein
MLVLKKKVKDFVSEFSGAQFTSLGGWRDFTMSTLGGLGTGSALALLQDQFREVAQVVHLGEVLSDILSGHFLFNFFGTAGIGFAGLSIAFAKVRRIQKPLAQMANYLLTATFGMGVLTFGVLFTQTAILFAHAPFDAWRVWLDLFLILCFMGIAAEITLTSWFLPRLIYSQEGRTPFIEKLAQQTLLSNLLIGLSLTIGSACCLCFAW